MPKKSKNPYRDERVEFTKEMKKDYTILFPTMLPIHFNIMTQIFRSYGFNCVMLNSNSKKVVDTGLESVHNDTCYPALLVIGQMIDALETGEYDLDKVALMITQTGGGCRASNYIHLLRKALRHRGYGHVPIISLNFSGMEKNSGFKLTATLLIKMVYALLLGDFLMLIYNQCKPHEIIENSFDELIDKWVGKICTYFKEVKKVSYKRVKQFYREILNEFDAVPRDHEPKVKVGIVGEIYVKYSPLGNNNLEGFLLSEGAEVVVPGLLDFCLYCVENGRIDRTLYGGGLVKSWGMGLAYKYLVGKQQHAIDIINEHGVFEPPTSFNTTRNLAEEHINMGVKMGEGWLLTAEIAELIHQGVDNVVCTQPFGCLPNHIVAKGKMRLFKEIYPDSNIVAIDYDPGATQVNQENRIKLMLSNAKKPLQGENKTHHARAVEDASAGRVERGSSQEAPLTSPL